MTWALNNLVFDSTQDKGVAELCSLIIILSSRNFSVLHAVGVLVSSNRVFKKPFQKPITISGEALMFRLILCFNTMTKPPT